MTRRRCICSDGSSRCGGYEQYEISNVAGRSRVASQLEVLDRRRVAWLRLRSAFHPTSCPLEEPLVNDRVHRAVVSGGQTAWIGAS
jgi:hypothetical protein